VNVSDIAAQFGGGGHPGAAGARISGPPLSTQRKVIASIKKAIHSAKVQ
jgi:nanoRNase/pAp phosphatase (c-di-AMP/oligoRNAs hydrolase)